ncbi:unnamed protein product [Cladocopium goreaui]|uniref:Uncharacterized protein n=1 Tax=Cladocopium goreaui TaxID=2562237 RepID=A0A9P1FQ56_9DINO|nr:unnamed protein product [Cladocopium goreaui]
MLSPQQSAWLYALPSLTVITACLAPVLLFALRSLSASQPTARESWQLALRSPLSIVSLTIILLSPIFLLSNYSVSSLYLFAVYCVVLACANLLADKVGQRRRVWIALAVWHLFNLLNLLGGNLSLLQPYRTAQQGLLPTIFQISGTAGGSCEYYRVDWCEDSWITFQMIVAFAYIILHVVAFFIVGLRAVEEPAMNYSMRESSEVAGGAEPF